MKKRCIIYDLCLKERLSGLLLLLLAFADSFDQWFWSFVSPASSQSELWCTAVSSPFRACEISGLIPVFSTG